MFADQLADVRRRIQQACQRSRRDPSTVTLVAVTKGMPASAIAEAMAHGVTDLGENRVQEAREKQEELGSRFKVQGQATLAPCALHLEPIRWHLIGHLQRNKAKLAVELFDVIHSVDSAALAEDLERHAAIRQVQGASLKVQGQADRDPLQLLIQVNVSGEATKFGCQPAGALPLARAIGACPHLTLSGLMTMAPFNDDPETARPYFRQLRQLRDELVSSLGLAPGTLKLSVGMSQDFEVAIEEGADYVRLGTALFGTRG